MKRTAYKLRPRSFGWRDGRIVHLDMTVEHDGKPLGGHNVQIVLGAADEVRRGLDEDVALTLSTGWWVSLRNQFAVAPCVAMDILGAASDELEAITAAATEASGDAATRLYERLSTSSLNARGPDYWI